MRRASRARVDSSQVPAATRRIHLDGPLEVPIYPLADLVAGQEIPGPAIVESPTTTVLLRTGDVVVVTPLGWLDIRVGGRGGADG